ncbi:MAG: hypothetical protein R3Y56_09415, partial [Akkermansia sp.]
MVSKGLALWWVKGKALVGLGKAQWVQGETLPARGSCARSAQLLQVCCSHTFTLRAELLRNSGSNAVHLCRPTYPHQNLADARVAQFAWCHSPSWATPPLFDRRSLYSPWQAQSVKAALRFALATEDKCGLSPEEVGGTNLAGGLVLGLLRGHLLITGEGKLVPCLWQQGRCPLTPAGFHPAPTGLCPDPAGLILLMLLRSTVRGVPLTFVVSALLIRNPTCIPLGVHPQTRSRCCASLPPTPHPSPHVFFS